MAAPVTIICSDAEATLSVPDVRHLFEGPAVDPLAGVFDDRSGLDLLLQQLKREKLPQTPLRLTVVAPEGQVDALQEAALRGALAGYIGRLY